MFVRLARRVADTLLWWRHTYTFNWAHRALCDRFSDGVVRFGGVHVCRSCALVYSCAAATALVALRVGVPEHVLTPAAVGLLGLVVSFSHPVIYERLPRRAKDVVRMATGCLFVLMILLIWQGRYVLGMLCLGVFAIAYTVSLRAYRRFKQRACDGCPELDRGGICVGYRRQAQHIRRYEAVVEQRLIRQRTAEGN